MPTEISSTRASGSTARPRLFETSRTRFRAAARSRKGPLVGSEASTTFSATVITGISMKCWCTMPMPASIACLGDEIRAGLPFIRISPASGW